MCLTAPPYIIRPILALYLRYLVNMKENLSEIKSFIAVLNVTLIVRSLVLSLTFVTQSECEREGPKICKWSVLYSINNHILQMQEGPGWLNELGSWIT
jgi:hypothetical protein